MQKVICHVICHATQYSSLRHCDNEKEPKLIHNTENCQLGKHYYRYILCFSLKDSCIIFDLFLKKTVK